MLTPLKPKTCPLFNPASICSPWCLMGPICSTFPDSPALYVQHVFSIGPAVWPHFPGFWIVDPLSPPPPQCRRGVSWGIHSQMNPQTCTEFGANRSIRLATFPDLHLWPPKTPRNVPCGSEGRIVFSYVHSQTNPQTCAKFGANRSSRLTASPDIWICGYIYTYGVSQENSQLLRKKMYCNRHESQRFECAIVALSIYV